LAARFTAATGAAFALALTLALTGAGFLAASGFWVREPEPLSVACFLATGFRRGEALGVALGLLFFATVMFHLIFLKGYGMESSPRSPRVMT
jgi:hypothetical protein